ncbi:ComEC/Rec2 family competence protein [Ekhidna sp. MALMAid0563]|uniref:ComEC/Rec2 family competence protein n=1 Tax=Ekhidna sp. MALMAid0563 TaxID=3143937 RepID=UPI0032DE8D81
MYFWNTYPFVRFTTALILGIVCFDFNNYLWKYDLTILIVIIGCYGVSVFKSQQTSFHKLRHLNGALALFILFFIGGILAKTKYHHHTSNHYTNIKNEIKGFSGTITSPVNERANHFRYDFELTSVFTNADSSLDTSGKIHLYIRKDSLVTPLKYGDRILVYGNFYPVQGPDNPNEFNYKKYLERQNIFSHAFIHHSDLKVIANNPPNRLLNVAYTLREKASTTIDKYIPAPRENGIAKALLLGIKDHLDNEVKKAYSSAGAMHVLAVSGLHVGIIYLIILILFGKLRESGRWGKYAFGALSVSIIWLYATLTGLSPSVLRAATMFSLVAFSQASTREGNIYNTLAFAAFILLLFDPYLIYSVGFQLSFAAVVGIVYLQPKLYRLLDLRSWLLDKAWAITCVSIAAQLATFPLSAYYFHQFPTYFLVSNLVVIPASFLMLVGGIGMLLIDPIIPQAGEIIGLCLSQFMWVINEIISYVHILPSSLIEWIFMDQFGLIMTYLIVITLIVGLHYRYFKTLVVSGLLGLILMLWGLISHQIQSQRNELVFYEISDKIAIDHVKGHQGMLYIDDFEASELDLLSFQINPHRLASHLRPIKESILTFEEAGFAKKEAIRFGQIAGKRFLIFDSTTFHLDFKGVVKTDYLIINNGAVKSLEWLKKHFDFDQLILSNKNSSYYINKMKAKADETSLDIHCMNTDGALRVALAEGTKKERTMLSALFTTNPD